MFVRIYTGEDGQSHFEELDKPTGPEGGSPIQAAEGVSFRTYQPGQFIDWHNPPQRIYIITLSGELEVGIGDGTVRRLGPGDVMLAEDVTGQGHTGRVIGNEPRVSAIVRLA